ncbi:hypothetical protein [Allorhodopirellula solitaria]|uniref:Uncharacterized protein n=1 Tax=Allorhodopirellula solitaria TaxID=2527987 RepID=A0A5C5YHM4_9BACT|nr:hypothetical protein [Allorhodopirellula solitaria]TWT74351.1 hypothetical protein CA85_12390 [Allorhodopirellula solitaria]
MGETDPIDKSYDTIRDVACELNTLHMRAAAECDVLVNDLIDSSSKDIAQIERLLDQTLDACAHNSAFPSYKRLCRYYSTINLTGAAFYANAYREMWGDD